MSSIIGAASLDDYLPLDEAIFPVVVSTITAGTGSYSGTYLYTATECTTDPTTGILSALDYARQFSPTQNLLVEMNNTEIPSASFPFFTQARFRSMTDGAAMYEFDLPAALVSGGGQLTVEFENTGRSTLTSPAGTFSSTLTTSGTVILDSTTGATATLSGDTLTISLLAASIGYWGVVSTVAQSFTGVKSFVKGIEPFSASGAISYSLGGSSASVAVAIAPQGPIVWAQGPPGNDGAFVGYDDGGVLDATGFIGLYKNYVVQGGVDLETVNDPDASTHGWLQDCIFWIHSNYGDANSINPAYGIVYKGTYYQGLNSFASSTGSLQFLGGLYTGGYLWSAAPVHSTSSGAAGDIAYDGSGNLYVCYATNHWAMFAPTSTTF